MTKIILIPSVMVLIWVLHHNIRKNHCSDKEELSSFLAKEDKANASRKKDISNLDYIEVPLDSFPFDITLNDEKKQIKISEYKDQIYKLSEEKMLNLIGISNTELKEAYGIANLELLTAYDMNYSNYLRTLQLFAECIYEEHPEKAVEVLEYCLSIGTDISGTYDLLGHYYAAHDELQKFEALYDSIPIKDSISAKVIVKKLNEIKADCHVSKNNA